MDYTTRLGSGPNRAHVNYECPCGCTGGVIYSAEKNLSKAGACCCGRKLWVGEDAEAQLKPYLEAGIDYDWDMTSVKMPWGDVVDAAMAWPKDSSGMASDHDDHDHDEEIATAVRAKDLVCGMMIDPATAAATSNYQRETYYFCAVSCKIRFEADPKQYVKARGLLDRLRGH